MTPPQSIALYIHFPFCLRKCLYCDFNSLADSHILQEEYVAALLKEMELRAESFSTPVVASTLYFGGGTPSLMAPELVGRVIDSASRLYGLAADAEITLEANPGALTADRLAGYRLAGVNRLSLGVQSLDDAMLLLLGRIHTAREALDSFEAARAAGFDNIGVDLIHSLPGQTCGMWLEEMGRAAALRPDHISAYALTVEEGTPFHRLAEDGELTLPDDDASADMFLATADSLCTAGYEHYEISNFALTGRRSRHNQVYWRREDYLGFGAGAHSFSHAREFGARWHNYCAPARYMEALSLGALPEEPRQKLTREEAVSEWLFLGLRMLEGVDKEAFEALFGASLDGVYGAQIASLLHEGLLEDSGRRLRLSRRGVILSNQVFLRFV